MNKKVVIRVEKLRKTYESKKGSIEAIEDLSFNVFENEFLGIVGPSGCGKSTLLQLIVGILPTTKGEIYVKEEQVTGPQKDIGMVFQFPTLLSWRKVIDNVLLPIEILHLDRKTHVKKALDLLKMVGLQGFEHKYPAELSGGMQMRVSLARSLIHDPTLLLMDEPFGSLDYMTRQGLNIELLRIWQEKKKTLLYVTHDISEAVFLSDRVLVLSQRPAKLIEVAEIDLPRPRDFKKTKTSVEYVDVVERIREKCSRCAYD